jgi:hypothetical protein
MIEQIWMLNTKTITGRPKSRVKGKGEEDVSSASKKKKGQIKRYARQRMQLSGSE